MPIYADDLSTTYKQLEALAGGSERAALAIMYKGAEAMIEAWQEVIVDEGMVDTGDMLNSVGATKPPAQVNGVWEVTVAPTGKDRKGVRNAEKAGILNYGTSTKTPKLYFPKVEKKAQAAADKIAQSVLNQFLETGQLPDINPASIRAQKSKKKG